MIFSASCFCSFLACPAAGVSGGVAAFNVAGACAAGISSSNLAPGCAGIGSGFDAPAAGAALGASGTVIGLISPWPCACDGAVGLRGAMGLDVPACIVRLGVIERVGAISGVSAPVVLTTSPGVGFGPSCLCAPGVASGGVRVSWGAPHTPQKLAPARSSLLHC